MHQNAEAAIVKDDERMFHVKDDPGHGYKASRKISFPKTNDDGTHLNIFPRNFENFCTFRSAKLRFKTILSNY